MRGYTILSTLAVPMLFLAAPGAHAQIPPELQEFDEQLPGSLMNDPRDLVWQTQGSMSVKGVQNDDIPGGGAARRYEVKSKGPELWSNQTYVPLLSAIARGDVVTVGFYARTVSADTSDGKGVIGVRVQENAAPYSGFADDTLSVGTDWKWYEVSGTATTAAPRPPISRAITAKMLDSANTEMPIGRPTESRRLCTGHCGHSKWLKILLA